MFNLARLERKLAGTVFAGKLHYRAVTGSTNTDALEGARAGAPHGSVYFAGEQRAGRGRGDHSWQSPADEGLYVSVLLRLELPAARLPFLPLAVGLAAGCAIESTAKRRAELRWPNDVLIGPDKVAGILVESKSEGSRVAFAVAGIGINVHQRAFSRDLATPATSLDLATGSRVSRQALLVSLLESLERETEGLTNAASIAEIPRRLEAASTWVRGKSVEVHGPQACRGITAGLDENGFLLVQTSAGVVRVQTGGIRAVEKER